MPSPEDLLASHEPSQQPQIQVLSDLHLEAGQQYSSFDFPVTAPWLLLAGDVGRLIDYEQYLNFISRYTGRYELVFLVLGNHEFFGLDHQTGIDKARELVEEPRLEGKVVLLHRNQWDDPKSKSKVTILGCTLWSHISDNARGAVVGKVKDYREIQGWSIDKHNEQHSEDLSWLCQRLKDLATTAPDRHVLVVTHHAPVTSGTSHPRNEDNPWSPAYATDILDKDTERWMQVRTWVYGHTHYSADFLVNHVRLVANQRGYVLPGSTAHEMELEGKRATDPHVFDPSFAIDM